MPLASDGCLLRRPDTDFGAEPDWDSGYFDAPEPSDAEMAAAAEVDGGGGVEAIADRRRLGRQRTRAIRAAFLTRDPRMCRLARDAGRTSNHVVIFESVAPGDSGR